MGRTGVERTRIGRGRGTWVARRVAEEAAGERRSGVGEETRVEGLCKGGVGGVEREKGERLFVAAGIGEGLEEHLVLLEDSLLERREREHGSRGQESSVISAVTGATYVCLLINPPTLPP